MEDTVRRQPALGADECGWRDYPAFWTVEEIDWEAGTATLTRIMTREQAAEFRRTLP